MRSRVPYDVINDFAPVSLLSSSPAVVAVHPSVPARSVRELLALAQARPGVLNYASAGIGTNSHITGELFNFLGKVNLVTVHFKGGGPALAATVSGEVDVSFSNIAETARFASSGRLRALGVSSLQRSPMLPDLPTVAEAGLPGFEFTTWHVMVAPKATPPAIVALLNERVRKALGSPDLVKRFQERGFDVVTNSPEELSAFLKSELGKWANVIKERRLRAE
jgi:tripartite-type tricarboxylate transporter receptor subunit TctC